MNQEYTAFGGVPLVMTLLRDTLGQVNTALAVLSMLAQGVLQHDISTLTVSNNESTLTKEQTRARIIIFVGPLPAGRTLYIQTSETARNMIIFNATQNGHAITLRHVGQSAGGLVVPNGQNRDVFLDLSGTIRQTNS